ncbi:MAG: D-alanyl-D-alanine carboxypeptidase [Clostridiales bacterium]|nr:D-alanyl-D-alanine carboxypeptidase [Clostridiales bacterium]
MKRKIIIGVCLCFLCTILTPFFFMNKNAKIVFANNKNPAKAVCVMEQSSRRVLYEYNGDTRLPMASTTKIATAAMVLDMQKELNQSVIIPHEAVGIEGSSVYLKENESYSVQDLLYGLMLRSGNDCATALALHCCGNVDSFCAKMNETAQRAGAFATVFKNPHGLPCKGHYTTARDLSLISCYAMENPVFRAIVATKYYEPCHWKNKNKMLTEYDGVGIKTGYTKEAGRCLVSAQTKENMTVICTVLSCPDMYAYSAQLLSDAFSAYRYVKIVDKAQEFTVGDGKNAVKGRLNEDFYYPMMDGEENQLEINIKPCFSTEIVGQIEIYLAKRLLFSGNLYKL